MAAHWARHGLNCNALALGNIRTDINQALQDDPAFNAWLEVWTSAGHWGWPEDLVGACVFLASSAADVVHKQVLFLDGRVTATA